MKIIIRLSLLVLMIGLGITTLASAQGSPHYKRIPVPCLHPTTDPLQNYKHISTIPMDPRNLFRAARARDKSVLWKTHLALQLVKHPELNERQVRIILDAISFSTPEFFAASNTRSKKIEADEALELITRRAFSAFPNNLAAELFGKVADLKTEDDILKLYFDISALPLKKRKASFRNASPNEKSDLWRTHLALFFVKRPELNEWQKEIILAAMSLTTPEYFEVEANTPAWKAKVQDPSRALEDQIITAFSFEDGAKIFATLGDDAELAKSNAAVVLKSINYKPLSDSGPYKQWSHSRLAQQNVQPVLSACDCSTQSDWCPISSSCNSGGCNSTQSGCGTFWRYACNGGCQ